MTQKTARLMHISSQQQEDKQEQQKTLKNSKQTTQPLKYGNFKFEAYQIQQNLLSSNNRFEEDYILPQKIRQQKQQKKQKINFLSEDIFELQDHTVKKQQKASARSQRQDSIIQHLNKMNITSTIQQPNPELNNRRKINKDMKNVLQIQFSDFSEDEKQSKNAKVDCLQNQSAVTQTKDKKVQQIVIKQVSWENQTSKIQFIRRKLCENERMALKIQREKSGINFFLPQFDMILTHDFKHILSCKKQIGANFQYIMSVDNHNFSDKSVYYAGSIVGNFTNNVFNIYDHQTRSIVCTTRFKQQIQTVLVSPMCYEIFLLNSDQTYQSLIGVQDYNTSLRGLDELYLYPINKKKISYFRNKKPQYNQLLKAFMLNFNGRVSKGSVKNFIIEDSKSGRQILMFGKGQGQSFNLFISPPLSPMIALGIVIPHFASKMLQK